MSLRIMFDCFDEDVREETPVSSTVSAPKPASQSKLTPPPVRHFGDELLPFSFSKSDKPTAVSAGTRDLIQGCGHAFLTTTAQLLFYKFDQDHIRYVTQDPRKPIDPTQQTLQVQSFAGAGTNYIRTLPRNMLVYTMLPEMTDLLIANRVHPLRPNMWSGIFAGIVDG